MIQIGFSLVVTAQSESSNYVQGPHRMDTGQPWCFYRFLPSYGKTESAVNIYESKRRCVNDSVAPAPRRITVAGVLDRYDISLCTSARNEWFSYDARGQATDTWESTPNSGGWYHIVNQNAPNGVVSHRIGYLGTGTATPFTNSMLFVQDGEGRLYGLWDQSAHMSVWGNNNGGTTFNAAGQPNLVTWFNPDHENFQWDPNTGRMTSWTSYVGNNQQSGTLTWNANGTLQKLQISDTADSSNAQTCTYGYDDLARLLSANCSPIWSQTFGYDLFGNVSKTGNVSYNPGYNTNNRALTSTYDSAGNTVNDGLNSYTYDSEGRPMTVGSTQITYDAFNRAAEIKAGSSSTQVVYAPDGFKFALMNGQTMRQYTAPLVAGLQAVYTSVTPAGPTYWRHADWLGSSRIASTQSQTVYYDLAYAPFGETYVETGTVSRSFTGQTQDITAGQTGIYDFLFRQHASSQGRWLVPDPAGLAAVDITNPQTWNRYAYVDNNPLAMIDSDGLCVNTVTMQDEDGNVYTDCADPYIPARGGGYAMGSSGGNRGKANPANNKICNATQTVDFIHTHQTDAATVAKQLNVPTANVLGLSGRESGWGHGPFASGNAFFNLETKVGNIGQKPGSLFPFSNGWVQPAGDLRVFVATYPNYLASAQGFAAKYGSYVQGVTDPRQFLQALKNAGFNTGKDFTNPNVINQTQQRMQQCP